jgi:hypothetical protein
MGLRPRRHTANYVSGSAACENEHKEFGMASGAEVKVAV